MFYVLCRRYYRNLEAATHLVVWGRWGGLDASSRWPKCVYVLAQVFWRRGTRGCHSSTTVHTYTSVWMLRSEGTYLLHQLLSHIASMYICVHFPIYVMSYIYEYFCTCVHSQCWVTGFINNEETQSSIMFHHQPEVLYPSPIIVGGATTRRTVERRGGSCPLVSLRLNPVP